MRKIPAAAGEDQTERRKPRRCRSKIPSSRKESSTPRLSSPPVKCISRYQGDNRTCQNPGLMVAIVNSTSIQIDSMNRYARANRRASSRNGHLDRKPIETRSIVIASCSSKSCSLAYDLLTTGVVDVQRVGTAPRRRFR